MNDYIAFLMYLIDTAQLQIQFLVGVGILSAVLFLVLMIGLLRSSIKNTGTQGGPRR